MNQQEEHLQSDINALNTNLLLKNIGEEKLRRILALSEKEFWKKKTCSISKNSISARFHFVLSGRIKMYRMDPHSGRELTLCLLQKDDVFDVIRLLDGTVHEVFFETLDEVHLISLPLPYMLQLLDEIPEIYRNLLPYLAQQMKYLEDYAFNLTLIDVSKRLARLLLSNVNPETNRLEIINDISNEEIAGLIGSTRAVVNRHLQEFKAEGILSIGRNKLEIESLQLLLHKAYPGIPLH
ncbi:MAG: Crp/Fnr family transcriptional regulator [Salinimicrobium sp.]